MKNFYIVLLFAAVAPALVWLMTPQIMSTFQVYMFLALGYRTAEISNTVDVIKRQLAGHIR